MTGQQPDPRQPGMICYSGYWGKSYRVIKVLPANKPGDVTWFIEQDLAEGSPIRHHCTPWEWGRDRVITLPDGNQPSST